MPNTRPQIRPPALRTAESASASRLELFFDLAYVLVVLELATAFYADLTWHGLATFAALYVALWFSWVGFTLYANRFDTDDVVFRIAKLAATLAIAGCAASASAATSSFSTPFAAVLPDRPDHPAAAARTGVATRPRCPPDDHGLPRQHRLSAALWAVSMATAARCAAAVGRRRRRRRRGPGPRHPARGPRAPAHGAPTRAVRPAGHPRARRGRRRRRDRGARRRLDRSLGRRRGRRVRHRRRAVVELLRRHRRSQPGAAARAPRTPTGRPGAPADERHDLFVYGHLPLTAGIVIAGVGVEDLVAAPRCAAALRRRLDPRLRAGLYLSVPH